MCSSNQRESVLDAGCGNGETMKTLLKRLNFKYVVGIDVYRPYLEACKSKKIYDELIYCDVRKLPFREKAFSASLAIDILEHLKKSEGKIFLKELERITSEKIVISTPNGFVKQVSAENPHETHKSGWYPSELQELGFTIKGCDFIGALRLIGGYPKLKPIFHVLRLILNPYVYLTQKVTGHIIATKLIEVTR